VVQERYTFEEVVVRLLSLLQIFPQISLFRLRIFMTNTAGEDDKSHGFSFFGNGPWKLSFAFLFKEEDLFSHQSRKGLNTFRLFTPDRIR